MSPEQESQVTVIQGRIMDLIVTLHMDMERALHQEALASVDGLCFQISELTKAHGHVTAAAFRKP